MLHTFKKVLANSEPSTHGGKADITVCGNPLSRSLLGVKRGHGLLHRTCGGR